MKKNAIFALIALGLTATIASAGTIDLSWSYNFPATSFNILGPNGITPLSGAGTSANGDGYVLQLGYYSTATSGNPFSGVWTPVFGPGTSNTLFSTASMGDGTGSTGTKINFNFSGTLDTTIPGTVVGTPAAGQVMSIRFYNAATILGSTYFGAASNPAWMWVAPAALPPTGMAFSILDNGTVYQSGTSGTPSTPTTNIATTVVPEPTSIALLGSGLLMAGSMIRRRK